MGNGNGQAVGLKKEINQLGFAAIALNGTIGAGIFALPAVAVAYAGLFSPWLYVACGFLIMVIVLVFARVASYFKDTGGPVTYAGKAFGPSFGFQTGWLLTLSRAASFAAAALPAAPTTWSNLISTDANSARSDSASASVAASSAEWDAPREIGGRASGASAGEAVEDDAWSRSHSASALARAARRSARSALRRS